MGIRAIVSSHSARVRAPQNADCRATQNAKGISRMITAECARTKSIARALGDSSRGHQPPHEAFCKSRFAILMLNFSVEAKQDEGERSVDTG